MTERVLGWHRPDPIRRGASRPFAVSAMDPDFDVDRPLRLRMRWRRVLLDQGATSACTGFGTVHSLSMAPFAKPASHALAMATYVGARQWDEWRGEDYDGSSVLGAMGFLLHRSTYLRAYWHCLTPAEVQHAVSWRTAVVAGTDWLSGMWEADSDGYVHATGTNEGGHAYALGGYDPELHRYRIDNSWGEEWGRGNGTAWIDADEMHELIFDRDGEAIMPRKVWVGGALL